MDHEGILSVIKEIVPYNDSIIYCNHRKVISGSFALSPQLSFYDSEIFMYKNCLDIKFWYELNTKEERSDIEGLKHKIAKNNQIFKNYKLGKAYWGVAEKKKVFMRYWICIRLTNVMEGGISLDCFKETFQHFCADVLVYWPFDHDIEIPDTYVSKYIWEDPKAPPF